MEDIEKLRQEIDKLDDELLRILAKRFAVVKKIGVHKKEIGIAPLDEKRWEEVRGLGLSKGKALDLPEDLIKELYELIHQYSLKIESEEVEL